MNVLHINPYSHNVLWDNLYEYQSKNKDINVDVYVPLNKKYAKSINETYSNIYNKKYRFIFGDIERLFFVHKNNKIIKDIEEEYNLDKVDIIHAHTLFSSGFIAYKLHKKYGIPYIVTLQNTDVNFFLDRIKILNKMAQKVIYNAKKVVFIGKEYKEYVTKKYFDERILPESKIEIIPYGIDDFWFENIYFDYNKMVQSKAVKILTVGTIDNNKNQQFVCEIIDKLIAKGMQVQYNIVGEIINKKNLNELIKKRYVKYLGVKNKKELKDIYRGNDVFVLLSKNETFGLVYAEAMSQGLPVLYTKGQGFDGNFDDGIVGKAVDISKVENGVDAIIYVLEHYTSIVHNLKNAVQKFNWKPISDRYLDIYKEG